MTCISIAVMIADLWCFYRLGIIEGRCRGFRQGCDAYEAAVNEWVVKAKAGPSTPAE